MGRQKWRLRLGFRSIQASIFFYTTTIVATVILGALALYLFTTANTLRVNYTITSNQMAKLLSSRMDTAIRQLDTLEARILESEQVRAYVFSDFSESGDRNALYTMQGLFEREIFTIAGYDYPFYHLSILTQDGALLYFGRQYSFTHLEALPEGWEAYRTQVFAQRGYKTLVPLHGTKLYGEEPSIAISRGFSRYPLNDPRALIEMQLDYEALDSAVRAALLSYQNASNQVVLYDENGQAVYPASLDADNLQYYRDAPVDVRTRNPNTGSDELVSKYRSDYTGWTVTVVTPFAAILAGLDQYIRGALLVGLGAILLTLLLAYSVARTISAPIISIKEVLQALDLGTLSTPERRKFKANYNELELLHNAVLEMKAKLDASLDDYVQMRALTIQSRLLALQSQMDPHFLYNTLAIMAILAEEQGDQSVADMCRRLVSMLRYISAEHDTTTLAQELEHTRQYAELIHIRFGDAVRIEYAVDASLHDIPMPAMVIQPLVENSVKYARRDGQPLHIRVEAYGEDGWWHVVVEDDGDGFTEESICAFREKVEDAEERERLMQHSTSGVGLANIYLRLHFFYEGQFEFDILNTGKGARLKVGAPLPEKDGGDARE